LELIGENHARDPLARRDLDLERIPLDLGRHGTEKRQPDLTVVIPRRQHERGPMTGLFVPGLRIKIQPDKVATLGNVAQRRSRPTGLPTVTSSWMLDA